MFAGFGISSQRPKSQGIRFNFQEEATSRESKTRIR